jgi:translation initiation factor 2B subunit (eIF-2B alpha/beta/delta family)
MPTRNKLIRIADTSAGDWATVREYEQNEIADNSDDEKRIRQAENRAIKHIKDKEKIRTTTYSRYSAVISACHKYQ